MKIHVHVSTFRLEWHLNTDSLVDKNSRYTVFFLWKVSGTVTERWWSASNWYDWMCLSLQHHSVDTPSREHHCDLSASPFVLARPPPVGKSKSRSSSEEDDDDDFFLSTRNTGKENFLVPETPQTPRGKRPPVYGRSPNSSHHKPRRNKPRNLTPPPLPPMSTLLAASMEKSKPVHSK